MTSSYVSDVRPGNTVFAGQFFMGLVGCANSPDGIPCQRRMGTFVFRGGHRFKVIPTDTTLLFAKVMNNMTRRNPTNLLFVGSPVSGSVVSDLSVPVLVNATQPHPTWSRVAAILNSVMGSFRNHFFRDDAVALESAVRFSGLDSAARRFRDLREESASAVALVVRFVHRVASLVEVALMGRGATTPRPHYIGGQI